MSKVACILAGACVLLCLINGSLAQRTCGTLTIRSGHTFWKISEGLGFSVQALEAVNPGVAPERLQIGQVINLPCASGGNAPQAPAPPGPAPGPAPTPTPVQGGGCGMCEEMLGSVNQARSREGLRPLSCAAELCPAAQRHSNDMARTRIMSHDGSDGSKASDRIWPLVDRMQGCKRGLVAENVAQGFSGCSASKFFDMWWNSPGHRANTLRPSITHMAVATTPSGNQLWATQVFAECRR